MGSASGRCFGGVVDAGNVGGASRGRGGWQEERDKGDQENRGTSLHGDLLENAEGPPGGDPSVALPYRRRLLQNCHLLRVRERPRDELVEIDSARDRLAAVGLAIPG